MPIYASPTEAGHQMAEQLSKSLEIIRSEVDTVDQLQPEHVSQLSDAEKSVETKSLRLREVEEQISAIIQQSEALARAATLSQARAMLVGRVSQFLETTAKDYEVQETDFGPLQREIADLQDQVDPQAKRDRLRDAKSSVSDYATQMLKDLPTEVPATDSRMQFTATPRVTLIEPERRSVLSLAEIGSDQNYLSIHLALSFALQKHFETIRSPVPGLLAIDQISRPFYPEGGDEKTLEEIGEDADRLALSNIAAVLFEETERRSGLQVILLEHAYIEADSRYVHATRERWTKSSGIKLIPTDWPER